MPTPYTQLPAQIEFAHLTSLQLDTQRSTSNKGPFLFVVKTPTSGVLSRSTSRSAAASINSHAQRWVQEAVPPQTREATDIANHVTHVEPLPFKQCVMRCRVDQLLAAEDGKTSRRRSNKRKGPRHPAANTRKTLLPSGKPSTIIGNSHPTTLAAPNSESSSEPAQLPVTPIHGFSTLSSTDTFGCASLPRGSRDKTIVLLV